MTSDRLAALLDSLAGDPIWSGQTTDWREVAARLAAAGVTVAQPAEDGPCVRCGYLRDSGTHDTWETCDETRGPCLDPQRHHPYQPAETVSSGNGIDAQPAPDPDRGAPEPLHGEIERLLIGMVRTSYPMDRTQYERGWNEALHAARKKVADLMRSPK